MHFVSGIIRVAYGRGAGAVSRGLGSLLRHSVVNDFPDAIRRTNSFYDGLLGGEYSPAQAPDAIDSRLQRDRPGFMQFVWEQVNNDLLPIVEQSRLTVGDDLRARMIFRCDATVDGVGHKLITIDNKPIPTDTPSGLTAAQRFLLLPGAMPGHRALLLPPMFFSSISNLTARERMVQIDQNLDMLVDFNATRWAAGEFPDGNGMITPGNFITWAYGGVMAMSDGSVVTAARARTEDRDPASPNAQDPLHNFRGTKLWMMIDHATGPSAGTRTWVGLNVGKSDIPGADMANKLMAAPLAKNAFDGSLLLEHVVLPTVAKADPGQTARVMFSEPVRDEYGRQAPKALLLDNWWLSGADMLASRTRGLMSAAIGLLVMLAPGSLDDDDDDDTVLDKVIDAAAKLEQDPELAEEDESTYHDTDRDREDPHRDPTVSGEGNVPGNSGSTGP